MLSQEPHKPLTVGHQPHFRERSPLLPLSHRAPPISPQSLPTRSGALGSSPENRSSPETLSSRPPTIAPGPRSCTSARSHLPRTDRSQTALPSVPLDSDTLALLQPLRYKSPQLPPPASPCLADPTRTPSCCPSAFPALPFPCQPFLRLAAPPPTTPPPCTPSARSACRYAIP